MTTSAAAVCIVSHDAGGAELISSYVRQNPGNYVFSLHGPAVDIFRRKLPMHESLPLAIAIGKSNYVLCGTSWQSDVEWQAIVEAKKMGKPSVAFLDHWANYQERFVRNGQEHLPDEIWVGDVYAERMAFQLFSGVPVRRINNPYFVDMQNELDRLPRPIKKSEKGLNVLYVCEPIREHALRTYGNERYWGYTEEDALRFFLTNSQIFGALIERIVIRPHPSENADKYNWVSQEFNLPVQSGGVKALIEEVSESDIVVGCESVAMVIGVLAGCRVVSCIPPGGKNCSLPQPQIESLKMLIQERASQINSPVEARKISKST